MSYLAHITQAQLHQALAELEKFPGSSETLNYGLVYNGKSFPPKLLLLKACEIAGIKDIEIQLVEIDELLKELAEKGFEVYPKQDGLAEMLNESMAENEADKFLQQQSKKKKLKKKAKITQTSEVVENQQVFSNKEELHEPEIDYSLEEKQATIFLAEEIWSDLISQIERKKNLILQGASGTGKSFIAKRLAFHLCQGKTQNTEMVQFHPSYSYEDFVLGIRPKNGTFTVQKGIFYRFCEKAMQQPQQKFIFLIEEVNRGNIAKIFGELLFLLETDKRGKQNAMTLTYSEGETFYLPENVHLICTMNTADHSLAMMDYALRRRFAFATISPYFEEKFHQYVHQKTQFPLSDIVQICHRLQVLNDMIANDAELGADFCIGHGYFLSFPPNHQPSTFEKWYQAIVAYEILPLLQNYWFDRKEKWQKASEILLNH
ncbi:MAG: AAA family ATPase [Bacteroidia bacterium]